MDNIMTLNEGSITSWNENIIRVRDSRIERIYSEGLTGYVTISFEVMDQNNILYKNVVTLIVGPNTIIQDMFGERITFFNLSEGMIINADFSTVMTASIPPLTNAYRIIVSYKNWPYNTKTDRVLEVDIGNRYLYTGNADDIYSQMRFVITPSTLILDRQGNRISLGDLRPGQIVRVDHANFMTFSIPPQTTAFLVQVL